MLRIGHGNGHNKSSLVEYVAAAKADSFGCNEAHTLIPRLNKLGRLTVASKDGWRDPRRSRSSCIVTRDELENLGQVTRKVSERVPALDRVAPDRVLVGSFFAHPMATELGFEGVAHFNLHPDSGPEALAGTSAQHPLVREYTEALKSTTIHMRAARQDGLLVVLTGDLQVRTTNDRRWSPQNLIAKPLGLDTWATGIDWIMFDRRLELDARPMMRRLFDHTGFVARLRARA